VSQVQTLTANFAIVTLKNVSLQRAKSRKLVNFGTNLPKRGIPPYAFSYKSWHGEGLTLTPNFTAVALKMWAYSLRNCKNW